METRGTTGEETTSYWFDLPIDVAEFEEKLGVGAESGDYRIIEKVLPYADEVHEHTSVYQLNELDYMYHQLSSDMQEEYIALLRVLDDGLAEALKKLPERKRNTLLMYYFLEMTESEIANLQKITQSGVFKNRHHALETMKKILKEKQ